MPESIREPARDTKVVKLIMRKLYDSDATIPETVDGLLARLGIQDYVPDGTRTALIAYMNNWDGPGEASLENDDYVETKVRGVIALMLELPEFNIH